MNKHLRKSKNVLYVVPAVLLIIMFLYVPALYGFSFSMYKIKYLAVGDFVGLQNYVDILTDKEIWSALGKSFCFTMSALVSTVALGLALALWLNNLTRGFSRLMQTVIMIPWIISVIVSALLWRWILADDVGLLPYILKTLFGVKNVYFIEGKQWSMFSLVFVAVWRTLGYAVLLLYAGLKSVPDDVFEAAGMDGANGMQKLVYIRIPLLKTQLLIVMIVLTLSYFNNVELPMSLTGGGPGTATTLISLLLYREAFTYYNFGTASALAILLFILNLVLVALYMKFVGWKYE